MAAAPRRRNWPMRSDWSRGSTAFASWAKLKAHVESVAPATRRSIRSRRSKAAFRRDDAAAVRAMLRRHPALRARVNEPVLAFDSPAIIHVRSPAMLDVLLEAGADINARSRWWAGGFGLLDCANPEVAEHAIGRGAIVDAHAAARLGMMDRLRELVDADPSLVHARGGDGQTPLHFASNVGSRGIPAGPRRRHRRAATWTTSPRRPSGCCATGRTSRDTWSSRGCRTDLLMAAALGDVDRVRGHLDAEPGSIRMSVTEKWFPKRNPRAGGEIYIWTLGAEQDGPRGRPRVRPRRRPPPADGPQPDGAEAVAGVRAGG